MVHCLAESEGIQHEEEIAVAMMTSGLEEMIMHFLPCRKYWARDGRTLCMLRQGREETSRTDYRPWWEQEVIDLEGGVGSGGGGIGGGDRGAGGGGGWKWGPRRDIDADGGKKQLITIGTETSGPLAYAPPPMPPPPHPTPPSRSMTSCSHHGR